MELDQFTASPADVAAHYAVKPKTKPKGKPKRGSTRAVAKSVQPLPQHCGGDHFIKGPIPLAWLKVASRCGYRAEAVGLLVWYAAGIQKSNPCKLTPKVLSELHVHPRTARRILERFASAGLVVVEFHRGRSPLVTITSPGGPSSPVASEVAQ